MSGKRTARTMTLVCDGEEFAVAKPTLMLKLGIFADSPALLDPSRRAVESAVSSEVFGDFVKALNDEAHEVTSDNILGLEALCEEFDFESLRAECSEFRASHPEQGDGAGLIRISRVEIDVRDQETRSVAMELELARLVREMRSVSERVASQDAKIASLTASLDEEREHRRLVEETLERVQSDLSAEQRCNRALELLPGMEIRRDARFIMDQLRKYSLFSDADDECLCGIALYGEDPMIVGPEIADLAGDRYVPSEVTTVRKKAAARLFKISADEGSALGQALYSYFLMGVSSEGKDDSPVEQLAVYAKLSADQGNALGQSVYAACLFRGLGVEKNETEALRYVKLSADQGNMFGQVSYFMYLIQGTEENVVEAAGYLKHLADQGSGFGLTMYGDFLAKGIGVEKNEVEAAHYLKLAADQGFRDGQIKYAECLEQGCGVTKDPAEADRYRKLAQRHVRPVA